MLHAKKMVLMPQDAVEHLQRSTGIPVAQPTTVQTPGTILSRLDAEMDEILRSVTPANEREKWKLYQQVLQHYQFFTNENRRATVSNDATDNNIVEEEEEEAEKEKEDERIDDKTIISSVPGKYKKQAEQLLQFINNTSVRNRIVWDKVGAVTINGKRIKDANIIDLVNDAMRSRKNVKAIGRAQFGDELRRVGVPREFIGNHNLLYENLSLSPPLPPTPEYTPQTSFAQSTPNSSHTGSAKKRKLAAGVSWKTLNI